MRGSAQILFLLLACTQADAAMYSCVDEGGVKVLRNYPCNENEKQQMIELGVEQSHSVVHSTREQQFYQSRQVIYVGAAQRPDVDRGSVARREACEKKRKELDGMDVKNLGVALVKRGLERDYEISCILPPEARGRAIEDRSLKAMIRQQNMPTQLEVYEKMSREAQLDRIERATSRLPR